MRLRRAGEVVRHRVDGRDPAGRAPRRPQRAAAADPGAGDTRAPASLSRRGRPARSRARRALQRRGKPDSAGRAWRCVVARRGGSGGCVSAASSASARKGGTTMTLRKQLFTTQAGARPPGGDRGRARAAARARARSALTALGVGAIIGAGIFVLTGLAANQYAGPALVLSFVVAGIGCALAGALLRRVRRHGAGRGQRLHLRLRDARRAVRVDHRLGPRARVRGRVEHGGARLVALLRVVPRHLRHRRCRTRWIDSPFDFDPAPGAWVVDRRRSCNLPALLVVLLVTVVLVIGIRESASFNAAMVILKLAVVLFVIVVGAGYVETTNWHPFMPYGVAGRPQGRGLHLLRLHRLRLGLDARRGGAQPAARRADRHHRLARCSAPCSTSWSPPC